MQAEDFVLERLILKIGNQLSSRRKKDLAGISLTAGQSETILFFDRNPGLTITDLKSYLQISHQAARLLVSRLEEKNLVKAVVSPLDARARQIYLTERGKKLCRLLQHNGSTVGGILLQHLTGAEKKELYRLLQKLSLDI